MAATMHKPAADVAGCVTVLAEAFGKVTSHGMFEAYRLGLRGLTPDQVKAATQQALERCRFMPSPAELRDFIFLRNEDRAVKAWAVFEQAVIANGYIRSVTFDDPIINATIRALGGWQHCCGLPASEFDTFLQKRFQDTYCALSRAGVSGEQAVPLLGWCDEQNGLNGYDQQPPMRIETGLPNVPRRLTQDGNQERPEGLPRLELKRP